MKHYMAIMQREIIRYSSRYSTKQTSKLLMVLATLVIQTFVSVSLIPAQLFAGDVPRYLSIELSPLPPLTAFRENSSRSTTSMWNFGVDFNAKGNFTTGPEIWLGTFAMRSNAENSLDHIRREDFQYSEAQKLDAVKISWNISYFESGYSMRGLFIRGGYTYTKVNSRADRLYDIPFSATDPEIVRSTIADYRHGVYGTFGQRWHFLNHNATVSIGLTLTHNFRRQIHVESEDPDAEADYVALIGSLPDPRISARPAPAADFKIGFLL